MNDISAEFAEKMKSALIEEIGTSITSITQALTQALSIDPSENDSAELRNVLISISQLSGYMAAVYNQLSILESGEINDKEPRAIGFEALQNDLKKKHQREQE